MLLHLHPNGSFESNNGKQASLISQL